MGTVDLTVKVTNISKNATKADVVNFFSYCGTVDDVKLQKNGNGAQTALLTFKQPYAYQTALLLNDATLVDRRISVSPLGNSKKAREQHSSVNNKNSVQLRCCGRNAVESSAPTGRPVLQVISAKGNEMLDKIKELDERYKVTEAGGKAVGKSKTTITADEKAAGQLGTAILSSSRFSKSAMWVSNVLGKVSKGVAELGNYKSRNTETRKQK